MLVRTLLLAIYGFPRSLFAATITPTEANLRAALTIESTINFSSSGTIALSSLLDVNRDVVVGRFLIMNLAAGPQSIAFDAPNTEHSFSSESCHVELAGGHASGCARV